LITVAKIRRFFVGSKKHRCREEGEERRASPLLTNGKPLPNLPEGRNKVSFEYRISPITLIGLIE